MCIVCSILWRLTCIWFCWKSCLVFITNSPQQAVLPQSCRWWTTWIPVAARLCLLHYFLFCCWSVLRLVRDKWWGTVLPFTWFWLISPILCGWPVEPRTDWKAGSRDAIYVWTCISFHFVPAIWSAFLSSSSHSHPMLFCFVLALLCFLWGLRGARILERTLRSQFEKAAIMRDGSRCRCSRCWLIAIVAECICVF